MEITEKELEDLEKEIDGINKSKFDSVVERLEGLKPTFENSHDNNKVWYDIKGHITDLEYSIIEICQIEITINDLLNIGKKEKSDSLQLDKEFQLEQKYPIEIMWNKQYEKKFGPEAAKDKFGDREYVEKIWKKKFKECMIHLALVCAYNKKYYRTDAEGKPVIEDGKPIFISCNYAHHWLLDFHKKLYDKVLKTNKRKSDGRN